MNKILPYQKKKMIHKTEPNSCTIISINCQSLNAKFPKIKLLMDTELAEYNKPIHVLCIQETWFKNTSLIDMGQFQIDDYNLITKI